MADREELGRMGEREAPTGNGEEVSLKDLILGVLEKPEVSDPNTVSPNYLYMVGYEPTMSYVLLGSHVRLSLNLLMYLARLSVSMEALEDVKLPSVSEFLKYNTKEFYDQFGLDDHTHNILKAHVRQLQPMKQIPPFCLYNALTGTSLMFLK